MNIVIIRGNLSSAPVQRELASGSSMLSLEVSTPTEQGLISVPVAWFDAPAHAALVEGDEVVVSGVIKRRFFRGSSGTQARTELVADEVVPAGKRRQVDRLIARCVSSLSEP